MSSELIHINELAHACYERGEYERAAELWLRLVRAHLGNGGDNPGRELAAAGSRCIWAARAYLATGDSAAAESAGSLAVSLLEEADGPQEWLLEAHAHLAKTHHTAGNVEQCAHHIYAVAYAELRLFRAEDAATSLARIVVPLDGSAPPSLVSRASADLSLLRSALAVADPAWWTTGSWKQIAAAIVGNHPSLVGAREALEDAVGSELAEGMSDAQLENFEQLMEDDALALDWLQENAPDARAVTDRHLSRIVACVLLAEPDTAADLGAERTHGDQGKRSTTTDTKAQGEKS